MTLVEKDKKEWKCDKKKILNGVRENCIEMHAFPKNFQRKTS